MTGRKRRNADAIYRVGRVEIDRLNQRQGRQVIMFGIQRRTLIRRRGRIADSHIVLDEPFVDGFGRMCHEHSAFEIGLAEDVGKSGRVIDVKAKIREKTYQPTF
jgi:hypothetical protein